MISDSLEGVHKRLINREESVPDEVVSSHWLDLRPRFLGGLRLNIGRSTGRLVGRRTFRGLPPFDGDIQSVLA